MEFFANSKNQEKNLIHKIETEKLIIETDLQRLKM
jgi:Tat protein secretion system quality control protein TatD with DNase activity